MDSTQQTTPTTPADDVGPPPPEEEITPTGNDETALSTDNFAAAIMSGAGVGALPPDVAAAIQAAAIAHSAAVASTESANVAAEAPSTDGSPGTGTSFPTHQFRVRVQAPSARAFGAPTGGAVGSDNARGPTSFTVQQVQMPNGAGAMMQVPMGALLPMPVQAVNMNGGVQSVHLPPPGTTLPPLNPQPVLHQHKENHSTSEGGNDAARKAKIDRMKKFECPLCFEYMDDPVGCGHCQQRCCRLCLGRVLQQAGENRQPQSTDPPNSAKCPFCRKFFVANCIKADIELKRQIVECEDTVPCPFAGCERELCLGMLKKHEAECPHVVMRCRYAEFGCGWVGPKKDLGDHDCPFRGGLGTFVEQFRQNRNDQSITIHRLGHSLHSTNRLLHAQGRQLLMVRTKSPENLVDVLNLVYMACCHPAQLLAFRDIWHSMIGKDTKRWSICNVLYMLPTMLCLLQGIMKGVLILLREPLDSIFGDEAWLAFDGLLLSVILTLLGILCVACFIIDSAPSASWTIYNVRALFPPQPLVREVAACGVAMIHLLLIEFVGMHPGIMLWHFVCVATVVLPAFVSRVLEGASGTNAPSLGLCPRAKAVVIFGLRYGLLAACCGIGRAAVAMNVIRLVKLVIGLPSYATAEDTECFLSNLGAFPLFNGMALMLSIRICSVTNLRNIFSPDTLIDFLLAIVGLLYVNALIFALNKIGTMLGEKAVKDARVAQNHGAPEFKPNPDLTGSAVLACCSFLLLAVCMT